MKDDRYTFRMDTMDNLKLKALLMLKINVPEILCKAIRDEFEKKSK